MIHQHYEDGFPDETYIKKLLKKFRIESSRVQFCADYGKRRAGFLWKAHSLDDKLKEWIDYAEENGVIISRVKFEGQIHSIWFRFK